VVQTFVRALQTFALFFQIGLMCTGYVLFDALQFPFIPVTPSSRILVSIIISLVSCTSTDPKRWKFYKYDRLNGTKSEHGMYENEHHKQQ
jgi:hypothetical protein